MEKFRIVVKDQTGNQIAEFLLAESVSRRVMEIIRDSIELGYGQELTHAFPS